MKLFPVASACADFCSATKSVLVRLLLFVSCVFAPTAAFAAFGLTDGGSTYIVDTGAGLVFQVNKADGNITSIVYNGTQYATSPTSHIASGLGSATTVTADTDGANWVKITLQTSAANTVVSSLTHYLVARNGENRIYMATYTTAEPAVGELRWITRLNASLIPNGPPPSNNTGNTGAIESSDVFGYADGTSTSKYYGDNITHGKDRAMDLTYCGATGPGIGCWMVFGSRESSSGGPFFRDIQNQSGGNQEIYNYMNSGHNQTEPTRVDNVLHGPYALVFTTGAAPTLPLDFSWMESLGLSGWVPASGRGTVAGSATGVPAGFQGVVGFANTVAQYWAVVSGGSYTCPAMKPGTYTATLYKGELAVATDSATVTAGATTTLNLASTEATPATIFRIGEWDGTPAGMLNADKIVQMHPQDVRNSSWNAVIHTPGVTDPATFPSIQFRGANSPTTIKFDLAPNQLVDLTVRIGITCAYNSGRPQITVNSFTSAAPAASSQPSSRSFTIGTYRGNNALFTYTIPAASLVAGTNTMTINPISGSSDLGTWLSAGWVYDAVELDGPIATPVITYAGSSPLIVSGTAEVGRTITLTLDGSIPAGSTTVGAGGIWAITYAPALSAGSHSFTAVASDSTGHSSPASAPFAINASVTQPAITAALGDTGTYANGATTSDRVFSFTGTAAAGNSVTFTRVGTGVLGTVTANGSGNWAFDYSSVSLPDGANSFYATASSGSGNSASSTVFTLNLAGAPRIAITRFDPSSITVPTSVTSVVFRVTFNHAVSGVTTGAFAATTTGTAVGTVTGVSAATGSVFDVTVGGLSGTGALRLDLKAVNGVVDGAANPEAGYTAGEAYSLVLPTTGNGTWIDPVSGGLWSDAANWAGAVIADGAANSANFNTLDLTASNTVHLNSPRTLTSLTFGDTAVASAASWLVDNNGSSGNTLTLAGATPTITVNTLGTGAVTTIDAALAGTTGFAKAGAGTLVLSGASPLTGPLNVNVGTVRLAAGGSLNLGNNVVNTALNTVLNVAGGSFATTGLVSAVTSSVVIDSGTANLGSFRTNSDFGATLRVNGGALIVGDVNIRRNSGAAADFASGFIVAGTGVVNAGTIGLGTQNSTGAMSIEGTGSVTATGTVTIANQATSARGGAMRVLNSGVFTSTDTVLGVLLCRTNGTNANNIGAATFTGGVSTVEKFTLGFDSTVNAGSATITVNGGTLYLGSGGIVKNGTTGLVTALNFSSGTVGAKADWTTAHPINLPSAGNITFKAADAANAPFAISLTGVVSGAGALTKTGGGSLTLGGASPHTYTGATVVNGGTLRVTATLATAAGGVTVNSGGVLGGNATVNRAITLNSGGAIAPDGATAIATLSGTTATWNGGGSLTMDLGASGSSDKLVLTGALTKGSAGSNTIALVPGAGFAAGNTYTLATYLSTNFTAANLTATGLPAGTAAVFTVNPTNLQLQVVALPVITSAATASGLYGAPFSYQITASNSPTAFSATGLPPGLGVNAAGLISGTPTATGNYTVTLGATNIGGTTTAPLALTIAPAPAVVTLGAGGGQPVKLAYDGTPRSPAITTSPGGLSVVTTYDGSPTPPTLPGTYHVVTTVSDANYTGTTEGTLVIRTTGLVRHAPTILGTVEGSVQVVTAENITLNGAATTVTGDLLVPGTPTVTVGGSALLAGTIDGPGDASPSTYSVTLGGNAVLRYLVRRVDPSALPVVAAPPAPAGTRAVTLTLASQSAGDFATLRNLTLAGSAGLVAVPPGTYGAFTTSGNTGFILGVVGATEPAVYNLQNLTMNLLPGTAKLQIVGPVILTVANATILNAVAGAIDHPEWLTLRIASGGLTISNANVLHGSVTAPNGQVTLNNTATINGTVVSDKLVLNGTSLLNDPDL